MTLIDFENLKIKALSFKYYSLAPVQYEAVQNFTILQMDDRGIFMLGENEDVGIKELHWATNEMFLLIEKVKEIGEDILVTFITPQWKQALKKQGFTEYGTLQDYWIEDISVLPVEHMPMDFIRGTEYIAASEVTMSCRWQSREFHGESSEWIKTWVNGDNPDAKGTGATNCNIIVHRDCDVIVGLVCVSIYGHASEKGAVVWIREIAICPKFQRQGIGKKLIQQSLLYGKQNGAKRAFLMADELNKNAIGLYEKMGFFKKIGDMQIDMIYRQGE